MIITLKNGNHISGGEFSVNSCSEPFIPMNQEPMTFLKIDDNGNIIMLEKNDNHITIPKSTWEMEDTPQNKTEISVPSVSQDILEIFCDSQREFVEETHNELINNLTIKQYIYPKIW